MKRTLLFLALMFCVGFSWAQYFDFSATVSNNTLYFKITNSDAAYRTVAIVAPNRTDASSREWWNGFTKPEGDLEIPQIVSNGGVDYYIVAIGDGSAAFGGCNGITGISAPYVTEVQTLGNLTGLRSVSLPSLTTTNRYMFSGCTSLESFVIPYGVTSIADGAFYGCRSLTSVTIPNSVTTIGEDAFSGCRGLTSVNYMGTLAQWCNIDFGSYANPTYNNPGDTLRLFIGNTLLEGSLVIPEGVESIKNYAFHNYKRLSSVTIPDSVTSIGAGAFAGCSGLTSVTIPNSVTSIGDYAFNECSRLTSVTIPNSVTYIGSSTFRKCSDLTSVTIPSSVTSIGSYAFSGCSGLTSVTIPNSVTTIGTQAFYGCSGLTSVSIGNSVTSIGSNAFDGCRGLTSVTIPNSVTTIRSQAFYGCSSLKTVYNLSDIEIGINNFGLVANRIVTGIVAMGSGKNALYKIPESYFIVQTETDQVYSIPESSLPTNFIAKKNGNRFAKKVVLSDGADAFNAPVDFTAETVEFDRSFYTDRPSTVCLPFVTTAAQRTNFKLYDFSSYENGTARFAPVSGNSTANRPYIIEYNPAKDDYFQMPTLTNVQFSETPNPMPVVSDNSFNFVGTLQQASMSGVANRHYYGLYYGYFVEGGSGPNAAATVNPFRSYFYTDGTAARPTGVDLQNEGEVGIELVDPEMNIQYSNDVYDLMGRCVRKNADSLRGLPKGIYIWKGKKMLNY